jgi:UDP-N-acetylglucosamine 2-epimerase (non-hydrolysing)
MPAAILHIVGARPNFMKIAPVHRALAARGAAQLIVHTGQHYDANMSDVFFAELGIPAPHVNLEIGSGSHAVQTAKTMIGVEEVVADRRPSMVLVYGDVNSTVAGALVCAKLGVRIGHVEAGLRSRDRTMPEEINRLVTDQLADDLFTPSADADENLRAEGIPQSRIHLVGNVMIDTLIQQLPRAEAAWSERWQPAVPARYGLVTLHRPSNVDEAARLGPLLDALITIGADLPLLFPVHPRTRARIEEFGRADRLGGVRLMEPVGYVDFLALQQHAAIVVTDSGGVQEETTYLGVPCLTVRANTERPVTATVGTNVLVGHDPAQLIAAARIVMDGHGKRGAVPPLWDGRSGERIAACLMEEAR